MIVARLLAPAYLMNGLDPIPHLKVAKAPPDSKVGCPVCKTKFAAKDGYIFLTHWQTENEHGMRERKAATSASINSRAYAAS